MSSLKIEDWAISKVTPYHNNPRNNQSAVSAVMASLKEFGWRQPIVVDQKGVVIVGHTRLLAAKALGMKTVPVNVAVNLSADQVKAYRLADNRVGEIAEWDMDKLMAELEDLSDSGIDFTAMGFTKEEMGILEVSASEDVRYLEDFEVMPQPKPKWILISAFEDDCPAIMSAVKALKVSGMKMEYSGAQGHHPTLNSNAKDE